MVGWLVDGSKSSCELTRELTRGMVRVLVRVWVGYGDAWSTLPDLLQPKYYS